MNSRFYLLSALTVMIAACAEPPVTPQVSLSGGLRTASMDGAKSYVILTNGNSLPGGFSVSVGAAGGTLTSTMDKIGVAIASSSDPDFLSKASKINGVVGVAEDVVLQFANPTVGGSVDDAAGVTTQTATGAGETYRAEQWNLDAVHAPQAWAAGYKGAGARVAIVDGGLYDTHADLRGHVDVAHSASFVPPYAFNQDVGTFWHATHVAGIVAAKMNDTGTVGIAPEATIIGVKVLHNGSGSFGAVIGGIYYAATPIAEGGAGANIINMSLGALFPNTGEAHLLNAMSRATSYANQRNVTVIAAAGNNGADLDHTANLVSVPAQSVGVVAVSATGPVGYALGATNFDRPASYTNYGQSAISVAGPGGDFVLPGNDLCSMPRQPSGTVVNFCWAFDMVIAPCRGAGASVTTQCFAAGTSMASPAAAGVAALIVGKSPGIGHSQVEAILRASADDLGKPGNDDFYGAGRVNAYRAIQ
jgi:subtilisin family serine protease